MKFTKTMSAGSSRPKSHFVIMDKIKTNIKYTLKFRNYWILTRTRYKDQVNYIAWLSDTNNYRYIAMVGSYYQNLTPEIILNEGCSYSKIRRLAVTKDTKNYLTAVIRQEVGPNIGRRIRYPKYVKTISPLLNDLPVVKIFHGIYHIESITNVNARWTFQNAYA